MLVWLGHIYISPYLHAQPIDITLPSVHFTHPDILENARKDKSLVEVIVDLINATPAGEEITLSVFKINDPAIIHALEQAQSRGILVRIIINDGDTSEKVNEKVDDQLKNTFDHYHYIENDISGKAIIHNKFMLFSSVETTNGLFSHIILQTSLNFYNKGTKKLQDMVILQDPEIYYGYLDFWYSIKVLGEADRLERYHYFNATSDDGNIKAYYYPKRKNGESYGKDDILQALKNIENPSTCHLRFAHGKWDEKRIKIIEELEHLIGKGAVVDIITSEENDKDVLNALQQLKANLKLLRKEEYDLHTKFFLVSERKANGEIHAVWTGSHNLTDRSLWKNFEVLLEIHNETEYQYYLNYFNLLSNLD